MYLLKGYHKGEGKQPVEQKFRWSEKEQVQADPGMRKEQHQLPSANKELGFSQEQGEACAVSAELAQSPGQGAA